MPSTALRGLAALASSPSTCGCSPVQGAHGRQELVSLLTRRAAPRRGALLRALGLPAGGAVGGERPGGSPDAAPAPLRGQARGAHRSCLLGGDDRLVLAAEPGAGTTTRSARGSCRSSPAFGQNYVATAAGPARPSDVVAGRRGQLLRRAPARRVAARALRPARADGGGLRRAGGPRGGVERRGRAVGLARHGDVHAADLPARLRLRHGRRRAGPSPGPVAGAVVGADGCGRRARVRRRVVAPPGHRHDRPCRPRSAGRARLRGAGGGGGRPSAGGALARAPARPGHDLLRPVPVAPARAPVAALRGPDARWLRPARGSRSRRSPRWSRTSSWVVVERPAIEAVGRWRPWTRRVPSFPADRHTRLAPSAA